MNRSFASSRHLGDAVTTYERRSRALNVASGVTAASAVPVASAAVAVASIPAVPWTQIAGAVIGLVAVGLRIGAKLKTRGAQALQGDERAVAGYAQRAARWSSGRRARAAKRLLARYKRLERRRSARGQAQAALAKMKLATLYGLEANARKSQTQPLVRGQQDTAPELVAQDPSADMSLPSDSEDTEIWWYAAGALALVGGALALRSRRVA